MISPRPAAAETAAIPARLPTLDGLRAAAILLVVPHTLNLVVTPDSAATHLLAATLDRGWIGVQLFFVLSGYLITGILMDAGNERNYYSYFYMRRILRIFPLYYATLIVVFLLLPAAGLLPAYVKRDPAVELSYWLYYSNWHGPFYEGHGSMPHLWSLAIEEQFYLLWPLLVHRRSPLTVMRLCLGIAAASLLLRIAMLVAAFPVEAIYRFLISRMDALALGGFVAAGLRAPAVSAWTQEHPRTLLYGGIAAFLIGAAFSRGYYFSDAMTLTMGYTWLAVAFALLVAAGANADRLGTRGWATVLRSRALGKVARYSYAMYVLCIPLHLLVGQQVLAALGLQATNSVIVDLAYISAGTLVTYFAAAASYHLFEIHFLRLKDRFLP